MMNWKEYKEFLINNILEWAGDRFTREELEKKTIRALEIIHDNCEKQAQGPVRAPGRRKT